MNGRHWAMCHSSEGTPAENDGQLLWLGYNPAYPATPISPPQLPTLCTALHHCCAGFLVHRPHLHSAARTEFVKEHSTGLAVRGGKLPLMLLTLPMRLTSMCKMTSDALHTLQAFVSGLYIRQYQDQNAGKKLQVGRWWTVLRLLFRSAA